MTDKEGAAEELARLRARVAVLEAEVEQEAAGGQRKPPSAHVSNEQYLRLIFESAVEYAIFAAGLDGNVTMWNEGARRILGYEEGEILGRPLHLIFVPEDRAQGVPQAEMRRCHQDGRATDERWHQRKDGSRFWASGLMMPLQEDDRTIGYLKILRDRTAERRSAARLHLALDAGRLAAWEFDAETRLVLADPRFHALWGQPADSEFRLGDLLAAIHPEDREAYETAMTRALTVGGDFALESRTIHPDGSVHWIESRGQPLAQSGARIIGVARDITERKAIEKQLHDTVERQRVMHREISHRVKNSLQLVANLLQLQAMGARASDVRDALNTAVSRVLAVAQVHDRLWRQDGAETVAFGTFLEDLCSDLQLTAPHCTLYCVTTPVTVPTGFAVSLGLVLNELVTNAFKYGQSDGRCIVDVGLTVPGGVIRLEVRDRGPGLPPGFDLTADFNSLGTRLINGMLRQLDGKVEASFADPGARFVVTVPVPEGA